MHMPMREPFPKYVLCDTLWDFDGQPAYASQAAFEHAVFRHHQEAQQYAPEVSPEENWQPSAVAVQSGRVVVRYLSDPPSGEEVWHEVELPSSDGASFTSAELLYKLHNTAIERLCDNGHHWFEGFELEAVTDTGIPVYLLRLGS
jgi:hypothetical protein